MHGLLLTAYWSYGNLMSLLDKTGFLPSGGCVILLYGCTTWTLTKRVKKRLNVKYTRMTCFFTQILEATSHKTKAVQPLTSMSQTIQDQKDTLGIAEEVRTNSKLMVFYGLLLMDTPVLPDQQGLSYIWFVWTLDAVSRIYHKRLKIRMDRESDHVDDDIS